VNRRISFRPQAIAQVVAVRGWYDDRRRGLGAEFATAVESLIARMAEDPLSFPLVRGQIRRAVFHRFPYAIYFRVSDDDIVVLAIHGRQHPRRWQTQS